MRVPLGWEIEHYGTICNEPMSWMVVLKGPLRQVNGIPAFRRLTGYGRTFEEALEKVVQKVTQ